MTMAEDEEYYNSYSNVSSRLAWILLVLLCKHDRKAELYKNTALSNLFLSNNLHYVVQKVRGSQLRHLLGRGWMMKNEEKARTYANNYVRAEWKTVVEVIPDDSRSFLIVEGVDAAKARLREFNSAFEEAYRTQRGWVFADKKMREYAKAGKIVRYSPEDLGNYILDLFLANADTNVSSAGSKSNVSISHK